MFIPKLPTAALTAMKDNQDQYLLKCVVIKFYTTFIQVLLCKNEGSQSSCYLMNQPTLLMIIWSEGFLELKSNLIEFDINVVFNDNIVFQNEVVCIVEMMIDCHCYLLCFVFFSMVFALSPGAAGVLVGHPFDTVKVGQFILLL